MSLRPKKEHHSSAGDSPAVSGATRPRFGEVRIHNRGRLPHWEREGGTYFVTFRLFDSLPRHVLESLMRKQPAAEEEKPDSLARSVETYLDGGAGSAFMKNPSVASIVADNIRYWNGKHYRLMAWCVMPNHVHIVMRLLPNRNLAQVLHSLKSFTAKQANQILNRQGPFWQREYYDRLLRNGKELDRAVRYVLDNPIKAGLGGWKWVGTADDIHES